MFSKNKKIEFVEGDLLEQSVEVIVNTWNRNFIPWWLLLPQGVSGAIKRKAGYKPFIELRRYGVLSLGQAVFTSAGKLPYQGIIHVAGIGLTWQASKRSIKLSTANALSLAKEKNFSSIAFPLIGAGTGGFSEKESEEIMMEEINLLDFDGSIILVKFNK
ncbi:MAG: macro domain-containing protein [Burkholderiales bacterium]|jgi:O-acetyl-ADP-ribose deacetylase (regulator of RNase III)|nr:macro domain-containing protein [Burkholderiales bacterium]